MPNYNQQVQSITQSLPLKYVADITIDLSGFVRISGVCVGRLVTEDDVTYFEVKDRNNARSLSRGAQLIRVPAAAVIRRLAE